MIQKGPCTPVSTAALFKIAKTWKRGKLSISRGLDKDGVVHTQWIITQPSRRMK